MGRSFEVRKVAMAKTAAAKTKVYSKYGKEIYVSAKNGGSDPAANLSLRRLIDKAKKDQVPSHVIEKAIEKAEGGAAEDFVTARYEGFGPGNCMVIVDCLTDNNNRTITDVRNCFTKTGSKIGAPGAVSHMFEHQAVFAFAADDADEEPVLEALMEADVDVTDVVTDAGTVTVFAPHTAFFKVKNVLSSAFAALEFRVEEITFVPQASTNITSEDVPNFEKFMAMLADCDDVQNVYHNAILPD